MLSPDEAYGLAGQVEEVQQELAKGQAALFAFARGKLGQSGQAPMVGILRIAAAVMLRSPAAGALVAGASGAQPNGPPSARPAPPPWAIGWGGSRRSWRRPLLRR